MINKLKQSDIILFHSRGIGSWLIRRIIGSYWNHIGHYSFGSVIEARGRGIVITPISKYLNSKRHQLGVVRVKRATKEDRQAVDDFIHILVGCKYDFSQLIVNIASLGLLSLLKLTHLENRLRRLKNIGDSKNEFTCSEVLACAWEVRKFEFIKGADTANISPADIANSPIVKWVFNKRK